MKFIQLCALFIGAFLFIQPAKASTEPPEGVSCEAGETWLPSVQGCGVVMPEQSCEISNIKVSSSGWPFGSPYSFSSISSYMNRVKSTDYQNDLPTSGRNQFFAYSKLTNSDLSPSGCPSDGSLKEDILVTITQNITQVYRSCSGNPETCTNEIRPPITKTYSNLTTLTYLFSDDVTCPDDYPFGLHNEPPPNELNSYCYRLPDRLPCDCSELQGMAALPSPSFLAKKGVYSEGNTPECLDVADSETGQKCQCQFVAKKWLNFYAGETYERWEPYPTENGGGTGTYTGAACNAEATDTPPPEKEECFTLQSGITWCWSDPAEKCTVVNGQEQCDSGCGYINGDFVCYESEEDPVIPPDRGEKDPINDDITDPNKSMADMTKGDFKEVNHGIEQRLNNVITTNENVEIAVDGVKSEVEKTNSKLDGIGRQLDGQGKTLKGIEKGLGDAFGDEGLPDGSCEGDCIGSWYESAYPDGMVGIWEEHSAALQQTPMFEFLDQFQLAPAGNQPDLNICFNLGAMGDFGCSSFDIPAIIWPFIKIVILISAAFLCRALIFGG